MAKKTPEELSAIIASHLSESLGNDNDQLSATRTENLAMYEGELENVVAGRSQVQSRDSLEVVEMAMPAITRTFLGPEPAAQFMPTTPEDEDYAEQITQYVNHCLFVDNPGFQISQDWFRSALITGTSFAKIYWDETPIERQEEYSGLTETELQILGDDETVEILEHTSYGKSQEMIMDEQEAIKMALEGVRDIEPLHDVKIKRTNTKARLKWNAVPPEEMLINGDARSIDEDDPTWKFACHRQAISVMSLIEQGYDEEKVRAAATASDNYEQLYEQRFNDLTRTGSLNAYNDLDPDQRLVMVYESYLRCDYEGTGAAQLHRVMSLGGDGETEILDVEPVEELPFAELTAIRRPHRLYGYSLVDLTKPLQRLKTALLRSMMDGLYLSLFPHKGVNAAMVEMDDLLSESPGSIYRVNGNPNEAIVNMSTNWTGSQAFPMLQFIDGMIQKRTGMNDMATGFDGRALTGETARGVDEMASAAKSRLELICRNFAETGWTRLMRLALKMINRHQNHERVVRLTGKSWVTVDPRSWHSDFDVSVATGLGVGTRQEGVQKLNFIASKIEAIMGKMGPGNPLANMSNYYNVLRKLCESADLDPELYFSNPAQAMAAQQGKPPQPSPEMMKMQAEMGMKKEEAQAKLQQSQAEAQMKAEVDTLKAEKEAEIARFKAELEAAQARENALLEAEVKREIEGNKLKLEYERMAAQHEYKMAELTAEERLERSKMDAGSRDGQGNINLSD